MKPGPTLVQPVGAFITVKYSYRRTSDLYVGVKGYPVFCAQCEAQFTWDELKDHILSHDRRKNKGKLYHVVEGKAYEIAGFKEGEGEQQTGG